MAQVFVPRNDLSAESHPDNPVRVVASYANQTLVKMDMHGAQCTLLGVQDPMVMNDRENFRMILKPEWRNDYKTTINAEARRRIETVFPEFKQSNYTAKYQEYLTQYGSDTSLWPPETGEFKAEYDRGWQYVADVRSASNAWTAMPTDPTADEIWPPVISPIKSIA